MFVLGVVLLPYSSLSFAERLSLYEVLEVGEQLALIDVFGFVDLLP